MLLTTNLTGFSGEWILALVPWVMFIPGISVATEESIKGVKFPVIFFAVACMSIGFVAGGAGDRSAHHPDGHASDRGTVQPLAVCRGSGPAGYGAQLPAYPAGYDGSGDRTLVEIASSMGINPLLGLYAFYLSCNLVFLPYESTAFLCSIPSGR